MYIFLASFRSQDRANNHNDKGDNNVNKQYWFYEQNNDFVLTHASHFFDIHSTVGSFMEYVNMRERIFLCLFELGCSP